MSPARAKALEKLGIRTLRDLLTHFPRSYVDLSQVETCASARIGETCTVRGRVHEIKLKKPRYNLKLVEIALVDDTGILIVTAFRQPWLMDQVKAGDAVAVAGKVTFDYGYKRMTNPFIEVIGSGDEGSCGAVVPVHPATEKLSAAWVRRIVANGLEEAAGAFDPLPLGLRLRYRLMGRFAALSAIHFPRDMAEAAEARRALPAAWVPSTEKLLEVRIPMVNRTGVVAEVCTIASSVGCNIQSIDIDHISEGNAVLSLILTDEGDVGALSIQLINAGFSVSFSPIMPKEYAHAD